MDSMYHQFWGIVANYYQKELTPAQLDQFANDTRGLSKDELEESFLNWRKTSHFMPTPSDINNLIKKEPVTPWQFCNELLSIISENPLPGPGQKSNLRNCLSDIQWQVYCNNEFKDGIRQQTHKTALYALMNSLERLRNKETKRMNRISIHDIKNNIDYQKYLE